MSHLVAAKAYVWWLCGSQWAVWKIFGSNFVLQLFTVILSSLPGGGRHQLLCNFLTCLLKEFWYWPCLQERISSVYKSIFHYLLNIVLSWTLWSGRCLCFTLIFLKLQFVSLAKFLGRAESHFSRSSTVCYLELWRQLRGQQMDGKSSPAQVEEDSPL